MTVVVTDWRWQRIPNVVTYPAMLVGVALGILEGFPGEPFGSGLLDHVAGLVVAFLVSYPLTVPGWMKPGDAKLLMAVGALRGGWFFVYAGMYGAILGGLLAIVLIVGRRLIPPETAQPNPFWHLMRSSIPYGVALGLGALLALGLELAAT